MSLLGTGGILLAPNAVAILLGALLAGLIVWYDYRHKGHPVAAAVMGACRSLVYCVAAVTAGGLTPQVGVGAAVLGIYVAGLTVVARLAGSRARWVVPMLIAGISLVDASFIAIVSGSISLSALAASGFAATLLLQRHVPGD
jgi:hypothetical protein